MQQRLTPHSNYVLEIVVIRRRVPLSMPPSKPLMVIIQWICTVYTIQYVRRLSSDCRGSSKRNPLRQIIRNIFRMCLRMISLVDLGGSLTDAHTVMFVQTQHFSHLYRLGISRSDSYISFWNSTYNLHHIVRKFLAKCE